MIKKVVFFTSLIFLLSNCIFWKEEETLAPYVINLDCINSEYDDYNASGSLQLIQLNKNVISGKEVEIVFSTNRGDNGEDFDIWYADIFIRYIYPEKSSIELKTLRQFRPAYDSTADEFGPVIIPEYYTIDLEQNLTFLAQDSYDFEDKSLKEYDYYFFASDRNGGKGGLDIYYSIDKGGVGSFKFNTASNEAYPSYKIDESAMYYCSDADNNFDIYSVYNPYIDLSFWLNFGHIYFAPKKIAELSSAKDDKCPYINGDTMVFTSNRDNGFGGYDLYYSKYNKKSGVWGEPKNLSSVVNTENNEYRPSIYFLYGYFYGEYEHILLMFSSDRPGGKGGYDLYLAVLEELP